MSKGIRFLSVLVLILVGVIALPLTISPTLSERFTRSHERSIDDIYLPFDSLRTDPADYIWPTDASVVMTSSFGEFRKTHFHAGIDISTNDRRGYKVFASREGFISRIYVSPYGYGKMLYVQHADRHTTTYAHLQRFSDELDAYVKSLQKRNERYPIDVVLDPTTFPVNKGDVIAYSGSSGIGSPHLHFEVRDEEMHPINPLLLPDFAKRVIDTSSPEFQKIAFTPLDFSSSVQGQLRDWSTSVRRLGPRSYRLEGLVRLSGSVGVSIKTADRSNHPWHRNAIYRLEFFVDSLLFFTSELNRFPENESKQIALHYDWHLLHTKSRGMQKLYVDVGNRLPFYNRLPEGAGIISRDVLEPGYHQLKIVAYDIAGNSSELLGKVLLNHPPKIEIKEVEEKFYLSSTDLSDIRSVSLATKRHGGEWNNRTVLAAQLTPTIFGLELPLDTKKVDVARVVARNQFETASPPAFLYLSKPRGDKSSVSLHTEFIRDFLFITLKSRAPFTALPAVVISSGDRTHVVPMKAVDIDRYDGTVPLSVTNGSVVTLFAEVEVNGIKTTAKDEFTLFPVLPERGGKVSSENDEFSIEFSPQAVYRPMYCRIEKTEDGYRVVPDDVLLDQGGIIRYRIPESLHSRRIGLFAMADGSWNLLASTDPSEPGVLKSRATRFFGEFALLVDEIPPSISQLHVRVGGKKLSVSFHLHDSRSGVDPNTVRIFLDDEVLIGEYDPYGKRVVYEGTHQLARGSHTIRVEASDRLGNSASIRKSFQVASR